MRRSSATHTHTHTHTLAHRVREIFSLTASSGTLGGRAVAVNASVDDEASVNAMRDEIVSELGTSPGRGYQEQERKVSLMSRADLNFPTAEEIKDAMEATAQETPVGLHVRDGRDPWVVAEDKLRERGQAMELRDPPSDRHQAELSDDDKLVGKWCLQMLSRCKQTSEGLTLDDSWSPRFLG